MQGWTTAEVARGKSIFYFQSAFKDVGSSSGEFLGDDVRNIFSTLFASVLLLLVLVVLSVDSGIGFVGCRIGSCKTELLTAVKFFMWFVNESDSVSSPRY